MGMQKLYFHYRCNGLGWIDTWTQLKFSVVINQVENVNLNPILKVRRVINLYDVQSLLKNLTVIYLNLHIFQTSGLRWSIRVHVRLEPTGSIKANFIAAVGYKKSKYRRKKFNLCATYVTANFTI